MEQALMEIPGVERVEEHALTVLEQAKALVITTPEQYIVGADLLKAIKATQAEIVETFEKPKRLAHEAHKAVIAAEKKHLEPAQQAERFIKDKLNAYDDEQARIAAEQTRLAQEQANREAQERQLAEAIALEEAAKETGDETLREEAEVVFAAPVVAPTVTVAKATPIVSGIARASRWEAEVVDFHALVKHVAANPTEVVLLLANTSVLNKMAGIHKGQLRVPGVVAKEIRDIRAGKR